MFLCSVLLCNFRQNSLQCWHLSAKKGLTPGGSMMWWRNMLSIGIWTFQKQPPVPRKKGHWYGQPHLKAARVCFDCGITHTHDHLSFKASPDSPEKPFIMKESVEREYKTRKSKCRSFPSLQNYIFSGCQRRQNYLMRSRQVGLGSWAWRYSHLLVFRK